MSLLKYVLDIGLGGLENSPTFILLSQLGTFIGSLMLIAALVGGPVGYIVSKLRRDKENANLCAAITITGVVLLILWMC